MSSISVSWPKGDCGLYGIDKLTGRRKIDPEFVSWSLDMRNWSVAESSLAHFPGLRGKIRTR